MAKKNKTAQNVVTGIYHTLQSHFGPQDWWPGDTPFEIAVGAILTQNTNWLNVEKAIANLKKENVLDAKALHRMHHGELASFIKPAGYFNGKTKRLKNFLAFLITTYEGRMENMMKEDTDTLREALLGVNGIGPETADSILLYALEKPLFVIDAYTKRVLSRHNVVSEGAAYSELQDLFHRNLTADTGLFNEYHALFVMVGKHYCRPKPRCSGCPLEYLEGTSGQKK